MAEFFEYLPHPHVKNRLAAGPPTVAAAAKKVHGDTWIGRFNARVGLKITVIVGTMWAAYLFTLLALVSAPSAFKSHDLIVMVAWIAQTLLQLVLLPIIIVGQNIQAKGADERAEATYKDATAILQEAKCIQAHLLTQDQQIEKILASLIEVQERAARPEP